MAGMFYSLQEVAAKLGKTEDEVKDIIKQGRLREFRDGSNLLFKVDEVEALMSDTSMAAARRASAEAKQAKEEEEISLIPEAGGEDASAGADTTAAAGEGVEVLSEADEDYKLADDTLGETKIVPDEGSLAGDTLGATKAPGEASLEEIEGDVNLDTFGSGSGLLDLSLQADDTSLGGILDEIYTPEGEEGKEAGKKAEASAVEVAAEAEQLMPEEGFASAEAIAEAPVMVQAYAEPAPDTMSNAMGIMLILPFAAVLYTIMVTIADFNNWIPAARTAIQGLIWYITLGAALASVLVLGAAFMLGGKGKGGKTAVKKEKVKKEKKTKKDKKAKKTEEAPAAEPEAEAKID
ncbi:MAG: helix-turn-helix domain-containing protein [Sedimentisphaerales bacterium]|nr:helix-turn-helix domain-containing protein [Sedimentisphaerales bacterium]